MTTNRKIILASKSAWRKKFLEQIGLRDFEVRESEYEEDMEVLDNPYDLVKFLALKKGEKVAKYYKDAIIISGDTFVIYNNEFIGKPRSVEKAKETRGCFKKEIGKNFCYRNIEKGGGYYATKSFFW